MPKKYKPEFKARLVRMAIKQIPQADLQPIQVPAGHAYTCE